MPNLNLSARSTSPTVRKFLSLEDYWTATTYAAEIGLTPETVNQLIRDGLGPVPCGVYNGDFVFSSDCANAWEKSKSMREIRAHEIADVLVLDPTTLAKELSKPGVGDKFVRAASILISSESLTLAQIKQRFKDAGQLKLWKSDHKVMALLSVSCNLTADSKGNALYTWRRQRAPRSDRGLSRRKTEVTVSLSRGGRAVSVITRSTKVVAAKTAKRSAAAKVKPATATKSMVRKAK